MKFPSQPAPDHIKPALRLVLSSLKARQYDEPFYICFDLRDQVKLEIETNGCADLATGEAMDFIQDCIEPHLAFGSWLRENDQGYRDIHGEEAFNYCDFALYQNKTRQAWLEALTT